MMKLLKAFLAGSLVLTLLIANGLTTAQDGVPAVPANAAQAILLFPDLIQDGEVSALVGQQSYTLLAANEDVIVITALMSAPGLITAMQLSDPAGNVLIQQEANSAAPSAITLTYQATTEGWYLLDLTFGAVAEETTYTLALSGTTPTVFDLFKAGEPPAVAKAHLIAATVHVSGALDTEPAAFLIPLDVNDQVTLGFQGTSQPSLNLVTFDASGAPVQAGTLTPQQSGTAFTSDKAQWVQVNVVPAQAGTFGLDIGLPRASGAAQNFFAASTGLTLVPAGEQPTAAPQTPAETTSQPAGELCGGVPARYKVGDVIVVSQLGDNLQILTDYTGGTAQTLELASRGDQLEILDAPVCYTSPWLGQDVWFWNVFSYTDNVSGWVAGGVTNEKWLCPQGDPLCDQAVVCPAVPVQFQPNDVIVVSQKGDNLQVLRYPGTEEAMSLATWKQSLTVLGGPACYYSVYYQEPLIYWNITNPADGMTGWVVDSAGGQRWVCPASNPTCDQ
jgi:hypothetical protein